MSNVPPPGDPNQPGYQPPPAGYAAPGAPPPVATGSSGGLLSPTWMMSDPPPAGWQPKQKLVAGLLGILIGSFGVHSFYLGNSKKGIIQIVATILTCGIAGIWGFIEGIMILIGNQGTDAYGIPLTE
jgi:TM2 domain-containing membrane protein YozV